MKDKDALILLILLALIAMSRGESNAVIEPTGYYDDNNIWHEFTF